MQENNKGKQFVKEVADIEKDFPQWYTDVVLKTELVDYGPVKGTMVIRPYGYAIWESIQNELNRRFKEKGVENAYFPMFIPQSYLNKEKEHVEGFAPEVAVVTYAGGKELDEPLIVRPTSETIICACYAKWLNSYKDLPILMNQWANVVRWEKTTRPFLRTSEFLWQEGHTVHRTAEEAEEFTQTMLEVYKDFAEEFLAIPVLTGKKTEKEKFAGAIATYGMEAMMFDGKSLQAGTSHYLGQNFAKASEMKFLDSDNVQKYGYSTSWGVSTRLIGALIMAHGDQRGLILPPKVAPVQAVIIPVAAHKGGVIEKASEVCDKLKKLGVRVKVDTRDMSPGWKFNEWEMKGVPVRIEIGPRDIENNVVMIARRDNLEKFTMSFDDLEEKIHALLDTIQNDMFEKSKTMRDSRIIKCKSIEEIKNAVDNGCFALASWCGDRACEDKVKELLQATTRVMQDGELISETCAICGEKAVTNVIFARAY